MIGVVVLGCFWYIGAWLSTGTRASTCAGLPRDPAGVTSQHQTTRPAPGSRPPPARWRSSSSSGTSPSTTWCSRTGPRTWRALGGNSVHAASAARRRREHARPSSPAAARTSRRRRWPRWPRRGSTCRASVDVAGPDGAELGRLRGGRPPALALPHAARSGRPRWPRSRWTSTRRPAARRPVVHVAAMPLATPRRVVGCGAASGRPTRRSRWTRTRTGTAECATGCSRLAVAGRCLRAEPGGARRADRRRRPVGGLRGLRARRGLVRGGQGGRATGAYVLEDAGRGAHVAGPADRRSSTPTGAGDTFCGGFAAGLARGLRRSSRRLALGAAVAGTAIGAVGSLRLLERGRGLEPTWTGWRPACPARRRPVDLRGRRRTAGATASRGHRLRHRRHAPGDRDDPRRRRRRARRRRAATSARWRDWLVERGSRHLWLTGCGDSAFAGIGGDAGVPAAQPAARRTPVHALDLARYQVRYLPPDSAVLAISFSGKVGRTIEAAVQARHVRRPGDRPDQRAGRPAGAGGRRDRAARGADARLLPRHVDLRRDAGDAARARRGAGRARGRPATQLLRRSWRGCPSRSRRRSTRAPTAAPEVAHGCARRRRGSRSSAPGPNEATARFGAAKLFEGPQQLGVATNLEEWAHEEYFITSAGDPVVLVNPDGCRARPWPGDPVRAAVHGRQCRWSSPTCSRRAVRRPRCSCRWPPACPRSCRRSPPALPLALLGFHLARLAGKQSLQLPERGQHATSTTTPSTAPRSGSPHERAQAPLADVVAEAGRRGRRLTPSTASTVRLLGRAGRRAARPRRRCRWAAARPTATSTS